MGKAPGATVVFPKRCGSRSPNRGRMNQGTGETGGCAAGRAMEKCEAAGRDTCGANVSRREENTDAKLENFVAGHCAAIFLPCGKWWLEVVCADNFLQGHAPRTRSWAKGMLAFFLIFIKRKIFDNRAGAPKVGTSLPPHQVSQPEYKGVK